MWLAYNTNGLAHHRLGEAFELLADLGYEGVALTPDVGHLDLMTTTEREWEACAKELERLKLRCVVETGARFVLDPRRKHWPNLVTRDDAAAERRVAYYRRAIRLAQVLKAEAVSLWSGALDDDDGVSIQGKERSTAAVQGDWQRLVDRLHRVLDAAASAGVKVCFEPEPGMLVDSLAAYRELRRRLDRADLGTTIDVGHLLVTEAGPPQSHLAEFAGSLVNVQLDDARRGRHEHLPLGEGELDLAGVLHELEQLRYAGPVALELSRDSHRGAEMARRALEAIRAARR